MKDAIFKELKDDMEKAIQSMEKSFNKVRTGRASLSLLDGIKVDYYGAATPLSQVATPIRAGKPPDSDLPLGYQRHRGH